MSNTAYRYLLVGGETRLVAFDLDAYYLKGEPVSTATGLAFPCEGCATLTTALADKEAERLSDHAAAEEIITAREKEIDRLRAELDTLVAEARGAGSFVRIFRQRVEESCGLVASSVNKLIIDSQHLMKMEMREQRPDTQAHTQRQRDEGYNEGVEAAAQAASNLHLQQRGLSAHDGRIFADAILALRRQT